MIVRTYGRRNRGLSTTYSDSLHDDASQDTIPSSSSSQDFFNNNNTAGGSLFFSSQESSSFFPSFDPDPYAFNSSQEPGHADGGVSRKSKRPRNSKNASRPPPSSSSGFFPVSSTTLMEAQEFGEMMEHVDEVNFALDGLKKEQPVRIRRASLVSLLSICGTAHQRRLLRTQGMAKTIIDAILGLSLDDSCSNLAAAALFYALTNEGQDDHMLESPRCIGFLIKLLKPVISTSTVDKTRNIGSKLLALRKDHDVLRDTRKVVDSSTTIVLAKVQEILACCKDIKLHGVDDNGVEGPELNPKWVALLTMEKACLSKISFEDTSGAVRKVGGNFKEKLRELGGLDAVFEVALNCHSVMESWIEHGSPPIQNGKGDLHFPSLVLFLKCLKIMENATFLSNDNQNHLLGLKKHLDCRGHQLSFTKLVISAIKILSSLYLLKRSSTRFDVGNSLSLSNGRDNASDLAFVAGQKVDSNDVICISSSTNSCTTERISSENSFSTSQKSIALSNLSASFSETSTSFIDDASQLKMRVRSSTSSSCSERVRSCNGAMPASNGSRKKFGLAERPKSSRDNFCDLSEDSQDPFAFDEEELEPSKWDLLSGKKRISQARNGRIISRVLEDGCLYEPISQEESSKDRIFQHDSDNGRHHDSQKSPSSAGFEEEISALLEDCLLTAVKVLMNLTNDNPVGCRQIATCGGLETMSSLIVGHFPFFNSSLSLIGQMKEASSSLEIQHEIGCHLSDQELDLLVAILGLLVNLVEKDGNNRSRLARTSVSLPSPEGLEENQRDVIPLLCSIFLANQGAGDASGDGNVEPFNEEAAMLQGEKEAEKMIVEAYTALLLAFLSTESESIRDSIADFLPNQNLAILVPVLERFLAFHLTLNMISPETHKAVSEVIESCRGS